MHTPARVRAWHEAAREAARQALQQVARRGASASYRLGVMQAARQALQQVARRGAQHVKGSRGMASDASSEKAHLDEAMKEMSKWRTVTYAAVPTCIAVAAWDLSHQHEHHEEVPDYPYMRIRSKDFPWGPCGLFEMHCPDAEGGEE